MTYQGDVAHAHTRKQVLKMQEAGLNVLSYFISDHADSLYYNTRNSFQYMYPKAASFIDVNSLSNLSKSLNMLFERGQV